MKILGIMFGLLLLAGCASKQKALPYVHLRQDISRICLGQCGQDNLVTGFKMVARRLICECEGEIKKPVSNTPLIRGKRKRATKKGKKKK